MKSSRIGEYRPPSNRMRDLDVGVERIARWRVDDEAHLPKERHDAPRFVPDPGHLAEILKRPSLDERLPGILKPERLDDELLHPRILSEVREGIARRLRAMERASGGSDRSAFKAAADVLDEDVTLDREVRAALAALLRA